MRPFLLSIYNINYVQTFFQMMQYFLNFVPNIFLVKTVKYWVYFLDLSLKTAAQINLKLGMQKLKVLFRKKIENNNFIQAGVHCEFYIWNTEIFTTKFHNLNQSKNIWIHFFRAMVNWSPQFNSHPFRSLFES